MAYDIGDNACPIRPRSATLFDHMPGHREGLIQSQQMEEVAHGLLQFDGEHGIPRGPHAYGVPIVNKIPILSALFERKGSFVSNRKLLILLTARILAPEEDEPTTGFLR